MKTPLAVIIAVAIPVGVLLLLFVPMSLMRGSAEMGVCLGNLKQIDGASIAYMLESKKKEADSNSLTNKVIVSYLKGGVLPICIAGGSYQTGNTFKDEPTCSVHGSLSKIMDDLPAQKAKERKKVLAVMGPFALLLLLFFWRRAKTNAPAPTG